VYKGRIAIMKKMWEFFENMNEMVYVSDMDSYEVVYMNRKARENYGTCPEEAAGRKCYEVLQGSSSPCLTCTNDCLNPGDFTEWEYFNPIFQKKFALKDTMIADGNRRLRFELAVDLTEREKQKATINKYITNEAIINEALRLALSETDPIKSLDVILEHLGKTLNCERAYIFERKDGDLYDNTFEWCAEGISAEKDKLQNLPKNALQFWLDWFEENESMIIRNLDDTKETDPVGYQYLAPQNIHSLVANPLRYNGRLIGFYGVDNPPENSLENISTAFQIMGHFIVSLIRRRDLFIRMENLSYRDQLTGLGNRHAMNKYVGEIDCKKSVGIVYCDVTGLKRVNDSEGHEEGDRLIIRSGECIKRIFSDFRNFRIGGDEFLVICSGIAADELAERIFRLKDDMKKHKVLMAVGTVWQSECSEGIDKLLAEADERMYDEKRKYYADLYHGG
jgi:diguanylate cyclase (GGDEF)-like protein